MKSSGTRSHLVFLFIQYQVQAEYLFCYIHFLQGEGGGGGGQHSHVCKTISRYEYDKMLNPWKITHEWRNSKRMTDTHWANITEGMSGKILIEHTNWWRMHTKCRFRSGPEDARPRKEWMSEWVRWAAEQMGRRHYSTATEERCQGQVKLGRKAEQIEGSRGPAPFLTSRFVLGIASSVSSKKPLVVCLAGFRVEFYLVGRDHIILARLFQVSRGMYVVSINFAKLCDCYPILSQLYWSPYDNLGLSKEAGKPILRAPCHHLNSCLW